MARGSFAFLWIFQKNCIDSISSTSQKRQRLIAFILVNTIPTHSAEQQLPSKQRVPPPFFHSDTNLVFDRSDPFFWQNRCSGWNSGIDLVVAFEYTFFQLCSNVEQISVRLARFRRSYVMRPAVVQSSHTSCTALTCAALFIVAMFFLQLFLPEDSVFAHGVSIITP